MKKLLILAAAAALLLASCAKVETTTKTVVDENVPIVFSNYTPRSITKAASANYVAGTELVADAHFGVWGWYVANAESFDGTNGTNFFGNPAAWYNVTYKSTGGVGTDGSTNTYNDGARYWPTGDAPDKLSFYAYYPYGAAGITAPSGLGAYTFTAQSTAATQVDFMIADVVADQVYGHTNASPTYKGTVDLTFKHQLTKVQVKFKTTAAIVADTHTDIKVTSAAFGNINNTGKLTASFNGTATSTAWSNVSGTADYTIAVPSANLTATAANSGNAANDIFLLVPQTMTGPTREGGVLTGAVTSDTGAQFIDVAWTVTTDGVVTNNSKRIYLDECVTTDGGSTQANLDWAKNNFVTYIITIAPNQILFTGAAVAWDSETFGYYNIN